MPLTVPTLLALDLVPVALVVVLHIYGTMEVVRLRRVAFQQAIARAALTRAVLVLPAAAVGLILLHAVEIWLMGWWIWWRGLLPDLGHCLLLAGTSYTTLGYPGPLPGAAGATFSIVLAALGWLMFGWSTGVVVSTLIQYERVRQKLGLETEDLGV
ncbi:MAG: hypothetical protein U1E45_10440 [Geminicoccaceae bacterium]